MNLLSSLHSENTIKVLDICYALYGADKRYLSEHLPYSINKLGIVTLTKALKSELSKDCDEGLIAWTRKNIAGLFA